MNDLTPGSFYNLIEKHEQLYDKKTKKAELKSIKKHDYVPPPGHISFLKPGKAADGMFKAHLIFHNGVVWEHGRTWDFSEDWFCLDIVWNSNSINTGDLKYVQAFHTTTKPSGAAMENCSTSLGYVQAAAVDISDEGSEEFKFILFGGQSTETATTSNRLEIVTGPNSFEGPLHCKAYRSNHRSYQELRLPNDFSSDLDNIQKGQVPSSRCGHTMGKISDDLLICVGGLSLPKPDRHKFHPGDSNIFLLKLGSELEWIKLSKIEELNRTEHMMNITDNKVYIIGGHSFQNHVASEIFRFNQVLELQIHFPQGESTDYTTSYRIIELDFPPGLECNYITNFSHSSHSDQLYFFGGYTWDMYSSIRQNMYELCPPYVSHHVKPKKSSVLIKLDLNQMQLSFVSADSEYATADGSLHILTTDVQGYPDNILIIGGISGRVDLFSSRDFEEERCNLEPDYGGCVIDITTRDKEILLCLVPKCQKPVHRSCDTYTRGIAKIANDKYFCPDCAGYDPETKKKKVKAVRTKK